jgi:CHAT domain-containing protein/tetratricopeptide (TPR) repeat protein
VGIGLLASFNLKGAVSELRQARELALKRSDKETAAAVSVNLSSVLMQSGDLEGAAAYLRAALELASPSSPHRPSLLVQEAYVALQSGNPEAALGILGKALQAARESGDRQSETRSLDIRGNLLLAERRFAEAERDFLEAFRLRRLLGLGLVSVPLRSLGRWHFAQGEWREAEALFDLAVQDWQAKPARTSLWFLFFDRGAARARQGNWAEALKDYGAALEMSRLWRTESLSSAGPSAAFDVSVADLTSALAEAAEQAAGAGGKRELLDTALLAVESGRANSLRDAHLEARARSATLPDAYAEALGSFRTALVSAWRGHAAEDTPGLRAARLRLAEAEAGLPRPMRSPTANLSGRGGLAEARRLLGPETAFVSYLMGEARSQRWILTASGIHHSRIPGLSRLREWGEKTRAALVSPSALPPEAGMLAEALFGGAPPEAWRARKWLLSLDGPLFQVPLAALPVPGQPTQRMVERVALQVVPSLEFLERDEARPAGPRLIVGDPIYNLADSRRLPAGPTPRQSLFALTAASRGPDAGWQLPRLVGSGVECRRIAAQWKAGGYDVQVRTGAQVTHGELTAGLAAQPSVVHIAAHLMSPQRTRSAPVLLHPPLPGLNRQRAAAPSDALLILGLDARGAPDLLGSTEISALSVPGALVVLSGCDGGRGPVLPGAGLWALARAWIAAGASSVVASLWPIPDHSGEFFEQFYLAYDRLPRQQRGRAAEALRQVQSEWLRRPETARQASLWASFFVLGKE